MSKESQMLMFYSSSLSDKFRRLATVLERAFSLDGFFYTYVAPGGEFFQIGNRADVGEIYFSNQLYFHNPLICHPDNYLNNHPIITDDLNHESFHSAQKTVENSYGFRNFFCVPKKKKGCIHIFSFSCSNNHLPINSIFLDNRYALIRFGDYFFEEWKDYYLEMENYMINMGEILGENYYKKNPLLSYKVPKKKIQDFGKAIGIIDPFIEIQKLTQRERDCIELMLKGKTARQIGNALGIGHRTVFDYLDHVKQKVGCETKYDLFEFLQECQKLNLI